MCYGRPVTRRIEIPRSCLVRCLKLQHCGAIQIRIIIIIIIIIVIIIIIIPGQYKLVIRQGLLKTSFIDCLNAVVDPSVYEAKEHELIGKLSKR